MEVPQLIGCLLTADARVERRKLRVDALGRGDGDAEIQKSEVIKNKGLGLGGW